VKQLMAQFNSKYFMFRGLDSRRFNLMLCTVGDSNTDIINGLMRNIETEEGFNGEQEFVRVANSNIELPIQLVKVDNYGNLTPFLRNEIIEINDWLFNTTKFEPLDVDGYTVECMFTKSTSFYNQANHGYLTLNLTCKPYMTRNMSNTIGVNTSKEFTLDNPSNATQEIGLDMDIQLTGCDSIEIKNITTGKTFKLENLSTDDYKNLKLYGDLQYIKSKTNDSLNVFGKVTKEQW
jgi:phage-related protein